LEDERKESFMRSVQWRAAFLAIGLTAAVGTAGFAKPPDLPLGLEVWCAEGVAAHPEGVRQDSGLAISLRPAAAEPGPTLEPAVAICVDAWCPVTLPFLVERMCERLLAIMQVGGEATATPELAASAEEARRYYELACRCAREGKLERARDCLRQAHLANPTCRFGRLAIERLLEMEAVGPAEEASEPPAARPKAAPRKKPLSEPEREFQRMLERTQPLGLVGPDSY
jgi:hypothetical protein